MTAKFEWDDLKPGMLVEFRNGTRRLAMPLKNGDVYLSGIFQSTRENFTTGLFWALNSIPDEEHDCDIVSVYDLAPEIDQNEDQFSTDHRELLWTSKREGRIFDAVKFARWAVENPEEFKAGNYWLSAKLLIGLHGKAYAFLPGADSSDIEIGMDAVPMRIRREWTVANKDELESGVRDNAES